MVRGYAHVFVYFYFFRFYWTLPILLWGTTPLTSFNGLGSVSSSLRLSGR